MEIYVLDGNLEVIGLIDSYRSLIWTNRYLELGDCELYVPANETNMSILQVGNWLQRMDDEMVCRIVKRELQTDVENGDYLIVTGEDAKGLIDQRILAVRNLAKTKVEAFIRSIVNQSCVTAGDDRNLKKTNGNALLTIVQNTSLSKRIQITARWDNVGEFARELCRQFGYAYKVYFDEENKVLCFKVITGTDRSDTVVFSNQYENLATTDYVDDLTNMGNFFTVAGEGEGNKRTTVSMGTATSVDRYEIFVDARDLTRDISGTELSFYYPGEVVETSGTYYWQCNDLKVPIYTDAQLAKLQTDYPSGSVITEDGSVFYEILNVIVAQIDNSSIGSANGTMNDLLYLPSLYQRGAEYMAEYGRTKTFTGEVEPNITFKYKEDYFVGDIVAVESPYGLSVNARITEAIEVDDENGYRVEPTFEYLMEE